MIGFKIIRNYHTNFKGEISENERVEHKQFVSFVWCGFEVLLFCYLSHICVI